MNWKNFRKEVENYVSTLNPVSNLKKRTAAFVFILKKAAMKHVGKTVPGRKTFHVLTPSTKAAIKKRNELRKVSSHREEWRVACVEAREAVIKDKEQSWKDLLDSAITETDDSRL